MTYEPQEPELTDEELQEAVTDLPLEVRAGILEELRDLVDLSNDRDRRNYLEAMVETRQGWGGDERFLEFISYVPADEVSDAPFAFHRPPNQQESEQR